MKSKSRIGSVAPAEEDVLPFDATSREKKPGHSC